MNALFVNIKVDREERPDVDQIYMQAVQCHDRPRRLADDGVPHARRHAVLRRHLLPARGPPRHARLPAPARVDRRRLARRGAARCAEQAASSARSCARARAAPAPAGALDDEVLLAPYQALVGEFDARRRRASASAPKFPQPMGLGVPAAPWQRTGDPRALEMVRLTLDRDGARRHVRPARRRLPPLLASTTDWLVPHFEKMLYDNAQLASLYLHAGWPPATRVPARGEETLDYVLREMTAPGGRLLLRPGRRLRRRRGQVLRLVARRDPRVLGDARCRGRRCATGAWTDGPNFEGHSILFVPREPAEVAGELGVEPDELARARRGARRALYAAREKRVHPGPTTRCSPPGTA